MYKFNMQERSIKLYNMSKANNKTMEEHVIYRTECETMKKIFLIIFFLSLVLHLFTIIYVSNCEDSFRYRMYVF